jgi:AcrR family transcriptional regulator
LTSECSLRYFLIMAAPSRRASPLSPEARRASIIAATIPLLRRHGHSATTAQIALAAGIAEGTLFRVFPDKESLIAAAIETAFDPAPTERELAAIDLDRPLRDKLVAAVEILQRRVEGIWQLMSMLGMTAPPPLRTDERGPRPPPRPPHFAALLALIEPHAGELRCEPAHAARLLRIIAFAGTHPRIADGEPLTAGEIVSVLLDGIRRRPEADADADAEAGASEGAPC